MMDSLTDGFGQLSTNAKEWKPAAARTFGTTSSATSASQLSPLPTTSPVPQRPVSSVLHQTPPGRGGGSGWQLEPREQWRSPTEFVPNSWNPAQTPNSMSSPEWNPPQGEYPTMIYRKK